MGWFAQIALAHAKSKFVKTLEVYCQKEESLNLKEETLIVGYKVVVCLLQRIVTCDNNFSSPKLFMDLVLKE